MYKYICILALTIFAVFASCRKPPKFSDDTALKVEFSTDTLRNNNLIEIERKLIKNKEKNKFKLGITYNTLNTIYLNDKIYSKAKVVLLTGQLIEHALDNYKNASLLELYTKVANSYHQEVIGPP